MYSVVKEGDDWGSQGHEEMRHSPGDGHWPTMPLPMCSATPGSQYRGRTTCLTATRVLLQILTMPLTFQPISDRFSSLYHVHQNTSPILPSLFQCQHGPLAHVTAKLLSHQPRALPISSAPRLPVISIPGTSQDTPTFNEPNDFCGVRMSQFIFKERR